MLKSFPVIYILNNLKNNVMKKILIKFGLILTVLLFVDYVIVAIFGCVSCLLGAEDQYFCETYCWIVRLFIAFSLVVYLGYFIYQVSMYRKLMDGSK